MAKNSLNGLAANLGKFLRGLGGENIYFHTFVLKKQRSISQLGQLDSFENFAQKGIINT